MTPKQIGIAIGAAIIALGLSFSAGRFSAPVKKVETERIVKEEVKIIDQEAIAVAVSKAQAEWKKSEKTNSTTKILYKDGQIVEKIIYVDRVVDSGGSSSVVSTNTLASSTVIIDKVKETVEKSKSTETVQPRWAVGTTLHLKWDNLNPSPSSIIYEGHVQMRLIGGLWGGISATPQAKFVGLKFDFQF